MPTTPMNRVIQHLLAACGRDGMTDGELLNRFLSHQDDDALATLVRRHGPMVWGVCCRLLRSHHDAEDAFQATFLVLVRKAATLPNGETVGNWLYGVARQTAVRMRAIAAKRGVRERQVAVMPEPTSSEQYVWNDLAPLVDEELSRLPDKYRVLIVLCDLEGVTRKEVARQLDIPEGTAASRLATARAMLAKRLARRGVVMSGVLLGAMLSQQSAWASVPALVVSKTIKVASLIAAGQAATGVITVKVAALTEGVIKAMFLSKLKGVLAVVLVAFVCIGGGMTLTPMVMGKQPDSPKKEDKKDAGLIWTHDTKANTLVAYTPDGKEAKTVRLPEGVPFFGFTPDGTKMAFGGKGGKGDAGPDGLTLHVGDVSEKCVGADTALGYKPNDQFAWSPDGKKVVRARTEKNGFLPPGGEKVNPPEFSHVLFDVATKKETPVDLPTDHQVLHWSADGKAWLVQQYNLGVDPNLPNYRWLTTPAGGKPDLKPLCDTHSLFALEPDSDGKGYLGVGWKHVVNGGAPSQGLFRVADGKVENLATLNGVAFVIARRSPDGKRVACVKYEFDAEVQKLGNTVFVVFDADGRNETKLHTVAGDEQVTRLIGWFPSPPGR